MLMGGNEVAIQVTFELVTKPIQHSDPATQKLK
jgi:hypothetical protein